MGSEIIKEFLVGLGFGVNEGDLAKFNKALAMAAIKVTALYTSIQVMSAGVFKGVAGIAEGFEKLGYETRLIAPAINKTLELRHAMFEAYSKAGIDLKKVVQQSVIFNFSLAKTKFALEAIYKSVGSRFLPLLTKQMDIFRGKIYANMPKIQNALERFIKFLFKAFEATVQLGSRVWAILGRVFEFFQKLDTATDGWSTKILMMVAAWKFLNLAFLASPLGMIITGLIALLALWDDFKTFKEGGQSLINWGSSTTKVVTGVAAAIGVLGAAILSIMGAMKAWAAVQWLVNAAMTANPIGLIIVGVTALIALLTTLAVKMGYLKGVGSFFKGVGENILGTGPTNAGGQTTPSPLGRAVAAGTQMFGGGGAAPALAAVAQPAPMVGNAGGGNTQHVNQETNINIQGSPDANATGKAVSNEQGKVNFDMTRNLRSATR